MWLRPVADLLLTSKSNHQVSFEFQSNYYFTSKSSIDDSYFYLLALFGHRKKNFATVAFSFFELAAKNNHASKAHLRRYELCCRASSLSSRLAWLRNLRSPDLSLTWSVWLFQEELSRGSGRWRLLGWRRRSPNLWRLPASSHLQGGRHFGVSSSFFHILCL